MSKTEMQMIFLLKHLACLKTSLKRLSGSGCGTPSLHELVSTLLYSAWTDIFTVEDILHQQVTLSLKMKTCYQEKLMPCEQAPLYTQPVCISCFLP